MSVEDMNFLKMMDEQFSNAKDVREFVEKGVYVDDGLASVSTAVKVDSLVKRTQASLSSGGNVKHHTIALNSDEVLNAFPKEDLAKGLKKLDLRSDRLPVQRSLGLGWDLGSDQFTYVITRKDKTYTRRGVLS
jgi:hypothetical protein